MGSIILPSRRIKQPQQAPQIDWSNPITQGLVMCALPIGKAFFEVLTGQVASHPGTLRARNPIDGNKEGAFSAIGAASTAGGIFTNRTGMDDITGAHTIFVEGSLEVNGATSHVIGSVASGTGNGFSLRFDDAATGTNTFLYWRNNGNGVAATSGALGTNSEQFTHRVSFSNDGTNATFFVKGLLNRTIANSTMPTSNSGRRTSLVGFLGTETTSSVALAIAWNRVLTPNEHQAIYMNPWQVMRGGRRLLLDVVGGGGGGFQAAWALNSNQLFQRGVTR